jgi:hypothetical protein
MWPFSDVLDLPSDGRALQDYLKTIDLKMLEVEASTAN